jgi:UDP-glucuronate 4-epimerase
MERDFTFIDDIVEGIVRVLEVIPKGDPQADMQHPDPARSTAPYRLYNIGNHQPVPLSQFIQALEQAWGRTAVKNLLPMQPGDVRATFADVDDLRNAVGFSPATPLHEGLRRFCDWYRGYYCIEP